MPLKDYFGGGRSKHPKSQSSQSVGGQYRDFLDRKGTVRFQEEDSPWDSMSIIPAVPIVGAHYHEWTFYDNTDTSLTDVWTERKDGSGTVLGLLDNVGGGTTFTTGAVEDNYNYYESKQETVQIREGKNTWLEAKVKIPEAAQGDILFEFGFSERVPGGQDPFTSSAQQQLQIAVLSDGVVDRFMVNSDGLSNRTRQLDLGRGVQDESERIDLRDGEFHIVSVHIEPLTNSISIERGNTHVLAVYIDDLCHGYYVFGDVTGVQVPTALMDVNFGIQTLDDTAMNVQIEYIKLLQDE